MITNANNTKGQRVPQEFFGLSTDNKPTNKFNGIKVTNGSVFVEIDTKKVFIFDEENHTWFEQ